MSAHRTHNSKKMLHHAIQTIAGEFLLVVAVLLLLTQSFSAQAATSFDVICSEQGVVLVQSSGGNAEEDNERPCPNCAKCSDCLASASRLVIVPPTQNFAHMLTSSNVQLRAQNIASKSSAQNRAPMTRGPPSVKDRVNMYINASARVRRMGDFS
ncbi:hypothetical protein [uncultured Maritalea sp.]|jgi:hypothetical protein|uniref:hypothetical protein n=1 Tax=uncultured Maritalea sp. TaxID=757249 RepID=UPI00262C13BA|nr:hypothetical protein [uncultured Maritalea sp.]